jgi:8-oxo-dGTP diphosphatase
MDQNSPIPFSKINPEDLMPGLSIDCVIIGFDLKDLNILILKWQDVDLWALPGGFILQDEDMDLAATRILEERSGIALPYLRQFYTFGNVTRRSNSPDLKSFNLANKKIIYPIPWLQQRFISTGYLSLVDMRQSNPKPDLLSEACQWKPVRELPELLFDHKDILQKALEQIRSQINYLPIGLSLLPDKFTMKDLQMLYESILNRELDRGNFQKKMLKLGILDRMEKKHTGASHKAPYLYSFNKDRYKELLDQGIGYMS